MELDYLGGVEVVVVQAVDGVVEECVEEDAADVAGEGEFVLGWWGEFLLEGGV